MATNGMLLRSREFRRSHNIAKRNLEFVFVPGASIEVRPMKMKEEQAGFIYPKESNS